MTRDEAISRVHNACFVMDTRAPEGFAESFVTAMAELSGIVFEKPKSVEDRLRAYMIDHAVIPSYADMLIKNIDGAGLKIVEK